MFCKKCGNEIADGAKFCKFCGAPVQSGVNDETTVLNQQKPPVSNAGGETTVLGSQETTVLGSQETTVLGSQETTVIDAQATTVLNENNAPGFTAGGTVTYSDGTTLNVDGYAGGVNANTNANAYMPANKKNGKTIGIVIGAVIAVVVVIAIIVGVRFGGGSGNYDSSDYDNDYGTAVSDGSQGTNNLPMYREPKKAELTTIEVEDDYSSYALDVNSNWKHGFDDDWDYEENCEDFYQSDGNYDAFWVLNNDGGYYEESTLLQIYDHETDSVVMSYICEVERDDLVETLYSANNEQVLCAVHKQGSIPRDEVEEGFGTTWGYTGDVYYYDADGDLLYYWSEANQTYYDFENEELDEVYKILDFEEYNLLTEYRANGEWVFAPNYSRASD